MLAINELERETCQHLTIGCRRRVSFSAAGTLWAQCDNQNWLGETVGLSVQNSAGRFGCLRLVPPPLPSPEGEGTRILRLSQVGRRSHWHREIRDSTPRHLHDPA